MAPFSSRMVDDGARSGCNKVSFLFWNPVQVTISSHHAAARALKSTSIESV